MLKRLRRFIDRFLEIKEKEVEKVSEARRDPYAPRRKNVPYPNDEFGQAHMEQWLDGVWWKHHG